MCLSKHFIFLNGVFLRKRLTGQWGSKSDKVNQSLGLGLSMRLSVLVHSLRGKFNNYIVYVCTVNKIIRLCYLTT